MKWEHIQNWTNYACQITRFTNTLYATKRFAITWCAPNKATGYLNSRGRRCHALNALWGLCSCLYIAFELSSALSLACEVLETSQSPEAVCHSCSKHKALLGLLGVRPRDAGPVLSSGEQPGPMSGEFWVDEGLRERTGWWREGRRAESDEGSIPWQLHFFLKPLLWRWLLEEEALPAEEREQAAGGSGAERSWLPAVVQWISVPFKNGIQCIFRIWFESRRNRQAGEYQAHKKEFVSFIERICNQVWRGRLVRLSICSFIHLFHISCQGLGEPGGRQK